MAAAASAAAAAGAAGVTQTKKAVEECGTG